MQHESSTFLLYLYIQNKDIKLNEQIVTKVRIFSVLENTWPKTHGWKTNICLSLIKTYSCLRLKNIPASCFQFISKALHWQTDLFSPAHIKNSRVLCNVINMRAPRAKVHIILLLTYDLCVRTRKLFRHCSQLGASGPSQQRQTTHFTSLWVSYIKMLFVESFWMKETDFIANIL